MRSNGVRARSTGAELQAVRISKTYVNAVSRESLVALQDISLEVRPREFVCVIGPSGCGKSTFLKIVAGLLPPTSGHISVDGRPVKGPGADRGMVFQEYAIFPWKTVQDNVEFGLLIKGLPPRERAEIASHYLKLVGLEGFAGRYPRELSGGMKQRVAVARALANDPAVLLMDEPFGAVDALNRRKLQEELSRIWEETRKTIIFVTHSVDEATFLADRVALFSPRPSVVEELVPVDVQRPRRWADTVEHPEFTRVRNHLLARLMEAGDRLEEVTEEV